MLENVTFDHKQYVTVSSVLPFPNNQSNTSTQPNVANSETGDISKDVADDAIFALECVAMPVLTVFGIIGSLLSLVVLFHKTLRTSSTTVLLIGLAISDALFLIATVIRKPTCIISRFDPVLSNRYFTLSFPVMFYTSTCFSRISTLLVAVISIERLIAVIFPLRVKSICTRTRMAVSVVLVYVFTFGVLALLPAQYEITYANGIPYIRFTEFFNTNRKFFDIYNRYITLTLFRWLPKFVVVICNAIIIASLWKRRVSSENSENLTSTVNYSKIHRRITIMLVTVAIVFVITLLPGDAFAIARESVDGFDIYGRYNNLFLVLSDVVLIFEIINSSCNFVIYMLLNSTFSNAYLILFCPCVPKAKILKYSMTQRQTLPRPLVNRAKRVILKSSVSNLTENDMNSSINT